MIRVGIISDVHAFLEPMERALALLEGAGVDQLLCAGDLVDGGYEGDDVVRLLRQLDVPCVRGNHDEAMFVEQAALRRELKRTGAPDHPMLLKSETVAFVHSRPTRLDFEVQGVRVCVAHGTPTSNKRYLFPDAFEEWLDEVVADANADVVVLGHTHMPMALMHRDTLIVNPGSTAQNRTHPVTRTCGILTLPERKFDIYDIDTGQPHDPNTFDTDTW
ncbi:MAG: metallophosphoesterase family protein [Chloroflexota bacterium]